MLLFRSRPFVCNLLIYLLNYFIKGTSAANCENTMSVTSKIKENILCDYDTTVRPVIHHTNLTRVTMHMNLRYFNYDARSYTLTIDAWLPMMWQDDHLSWDPKDYDGVQEIHISSDDIWTPDISLYNKGDLSIGPRVYDTADCMVQYDGNVVCLPIVIMEALCVPNIRHWPYDRQICKMQIGSWIHRGDEIDFTSTSIVLTEGFTPNAEWTLVNNSVRRDAGNFFGMNNSYPSMIYTFKIKRHSSAPIAIVIIPGFVVMTMVILTLWLNPQSKDRIYLSTLNIPCHFLLLQHVAWEVPTNGDTVANIILFFRDSLLLSVFTLLETVVVRYLLETKRNPPTVLITAFNYIMNNRLGQIILYHEMDTKETTNSVSNEGNNEDGANLVDVSNISCSKEWYLLGKLVDKICFACYVVFYAILIIFYMPK